MKTLQTMKTLPTTLLCGLLAALALPAAAQPLGTAFTYQGQLKSGGSPANGLHDLRFRLYDALVGGTQVGTTFCTDNVSVTDGLFTVSLDFGAQFAGLQRFSGDRRAARHGAGLRQPGRVRYARPAAGADGRAQCALCPQR